MHRCACHTSRWSKPSTLHLQRSVPSRDVDIGNFFNILAFISYLLVTSRYQPCWYHFQNRHPSIGRDGNIYLPASQLYHINTFISRRIIRRSSKRTPVTLPIEKNQRIKSNTHLMHPTYRAIKMPAPYLMCQCHGAESTVHEPVDA